MNYYNEHDPFAAAWLRGLISAGLIPPGHVDERSITAVSADDLRGFRQVHFFAGIGGWSLALRLAGWPDDRAVWTGSCPCQPFSTAGKGLGEADARHLWPEFRRLIAQCSPSIIFGEQVASKPGRVWLAGVFADLEGMGYAVAGADLCAASVSAPHIRQRLYWMADAEGGRRTPGPLLHTNDEAWDTQPRERGASHRLANATSLPRPEHERESRSCAWRAARSYYSAECGGADSCGVGNTAGDDKRRQRKPTESGGRSFSFGRSGAWDDFILVPCADGKARRVGSGVRVLAHGIPGRVGRLRGYGNAVVPQTAAAFIQAAEASLR